jgi:hypothetical protein
LKLPEAEAGAEYSIRNDSRNLIVAENNVHILKSVDVMSAARIAGLLYGGMGLIFVPILLLVGGLGSLIGQGNTPFTGIFYFVFAILIPLLYAGLGFVVGAVCALIYNLAANWVGGLKLELESSPSTLSVCNPVIASPTQTPPA